MHKKKKKSMNQKVEKEKIKDYENVAAVQLNSLQYIHYIKWVFVINKYNFSFHGCDASL